jgi:hypothetical protein
MNTTQLPPLASDYMRTLGTFIGLLYPDGSEWCEFRLIPGPGVPGPAKSLFTVAHDITAPERDDNGWAFAEYLGTLNRLGFNIYCGLHPRREQGGTKASDVLHCHALACDFDDQSLTPELILERVKDTGFPVPDFVTASGHGHWTYWRLPVPITPTEWTRQQIELNAALGADSKIKDPPRLCRVPGFWNCKNITAPTMARLIYPPTVEI